MAQLSITSQANPIFATRNYFNRFSFENGGITVTSGEDFKRRPFSLVRSDQWVSEGSSDGDPQSYQAVLFEGSVKASRQIDFLLLRNINLKSFRFRHRDGGGAFITLPEWDFTSTPNTETDLSLSLAAPIFFDEFIIEATTVLQPGTQPQKAIGDVVLGEGTFQPSTGLSNITPSYRDLQIVLTLANGQKDYTTKFRSDDGNDFWSARCEQTGLTRADIDSFLEIKRSPEPFIYVPEPGDVPEDVHLCKMVKDSFAQRRLTMRAARDLYSLRYTVESIGIE